jgi:hypothetical protein
MKTPGFLHLKHARSLFLGLVLLGFGAGRGLLRDAQAESPAPKAPADTAVAVADTTGPHRVLAYYFHTTQRCATCRRIEAYTNEAIQTGFPEELKDGRLVFRVLNVDEEPNRHFVKDYKLFTKSVIVVDEHSGKETDWKNLQKIWQLTTDKAGFVKYIQEEVRTYLTGERS